MESIEVLEAKVQAYRQKADRIDRHLESLRWLQTFFPKVYEFRQSKVRIDATVETAEPKCWMCNGHGVVDGGYQYAFVPERCPACWCTIAPAEWATQVSLDTLPPTIDTEMPPLFLGSFKGEIKPWLVYFANKDGYFNILDPVYRCDDSDAGPDDPWTVVKHKDDVTYLHRATAVKLDTNGLFKSSTLFVPTKTMTAGRRSYLFARYVKEAEGMDRVLYDHWRMLKFMDPQPSID